METRRDWKRLEETNRDWPGNATVKCLSLFRNVVHLVQHEAGSRYQHRRSAPFISNKGCNQRDKWGDSPVVLSGKRTSVDTENSHRSCLPGRGQQKCAAGACWPARILEKRHEYNTHFTWVTWAKRILLNSTSFLILQIAWQGMFQMSCKAVNYFIVKSKVWK